MLPINKDVGDGVKYVISLDNMDLALLPLWLLKRNNSEETIQIWRPNNFLQNDKTVEFEVYAQIKDDAETDGNGLSKELADNVENVNNNAEDNVRIDIRRNAACKDEEIELASYIKILTVLNESKPTHTLKAINENLILITTIKGQKVQVSLDNFHSYVNTVTETQCRVCRMLVGGVKGSHKLTKTHLRIILLPLRDANCCRKLDNIWSHCVLCNEMIENFQYHIRDPTHKLRLKEALKATQAESFGLCETRNKFQDKNKSVKKNNFGSQKVPKQTVHQNTKPYYCWTCDVFVTYNETNIKEHNKGAVHRSKLSEKASKVNTSSKNNNAASFTHDKPKTDSIITRTEALSFNHKDITFASLKDYEAYCSICQIKMLKGNIESHLQGRNHKSKADAKKTSNSFNVVSNIGNNIAVEKNTENKKLVGPPLQAKLNEMKKLNKMEDKITGVNKIHDIKTGVNIIEEKITKQNKIEDCERPEAHQNKKVEKNNVHEIINPASVLLTNEPAAQTSSTPVFTTLDTNNEVASNIAKSQNSKEKIRTNDDSSLENETLATIDFSDIENTNNSDIRYAQKSQIDSYTEGKVDDINYSTNDRNSLINTAAATINEEDPEINEDETRCDDWCCVCF